MKKIQEYSDSEIDVTTEEMNQLVRVLSLDSQDAKALLSRNNTRVPSEAAD